MSVVNALFGVGEADAMVRYRYMLSVAGPKWLERAYAETFGTLTLEQRRVLLSQLADGAPEGERHAIAATAVDDAQALARLAARTEERRPGALERALGGADSAASDPSLLSSFALGFRSSGGAYAMLHVLGGLPEPNAKAAKGHDRADEIGQPNEPARPGYDDGTFGYGGDSGDGSDG